MYIVDYDCASAAGPSKFEFMEALYQGRVCSEKVLPQRWSKPFIPGGLVASIQSSPVHADQNSQVENNETFKFKKSADFFNFHLNGIWQNLRKSFSTNLNNDLKNKKVGLIFSSTKGIIEDFIYDLTELQIRQQPDPFYLVVKNFKNENPDINWTWDGCISNACCSSHISIEYIQDLFDQEILDYAVLISGDLIGPFIYNGFNSLKVLSSTKNLPFSQNRDGLQLGEALAVVLFSKTKTSSSLNLSSVQSDTEGSSITRPSVKGVGLARTIQQISSKLNNFNPDLIIAHGTGTQFNDLAEDQAFSELRDKKILQDFSITNTKWCIGHTLGASGCMDLIAGCEILKKNRTFSIATLDQADPKFKMNYLGQKENLEKSIQQILITSLGFGGVHSSITLERPQ
jgi:hypothetical protein